MNKMRNQFPRIVTQIKNSREQVELMNAVARDQWKATLAAFGLGMLAPVLLIMAFLELFDWWVVAIGVFVLAWLLTKQWKILENSVIKAKEQDRKYFLACIRSATNMEELHHAGLFGYLTGGTEEDEDKRFVEFQISLASALAINESDDFF